VGGCFVRSPGKFPRQRVCWPGEEFHFDDLIGSLPLIEFSMVAGKVLPGGFFAGERWVVVFMLLRPGNGGQVYLHVPPALQ
jgi:hypothetical protein